MIWWLWWNVARGVTWRPPPRPSPPPPSRASSRGNRRRAAAGAGRSGAPRPRAGRAGARSAGLEEVQAGRALNRALAEGRSEAAEVPRDPGGGGQRATCVPAGVRRVPWRSALSGPALWSPAAQHPLPPPRPRRPGAPVPATGLATRPLAGGRGGQSPAPRASGPRPMCIYELD